MNRQSQNEMQVECENCGTKEAITLADGMKLCADCRDKFKEDYDAEARSEASVLYEALENMLGDWYLFCLNEITRDDINEGSSREAMKVLKRLQVHRLKDRSLAIGQRL